MKDFSKSFADADVVLVPDIYAARDQAEDMEKISSKDLVKLINDNGRPALYLPKLEEIVDFLSQKADQNCVVVTMGAGDVFGVAKQFLKQ